MIGVSAVLLTLAIPLLSIETGTQAIKQFPKDSDVRVGNELASKQLGGGTDPVQMVASFDSAGQARKDRAAIAGFARTIESTPGVSAVAPPAFSGSSVLIQATPSAPSESDATIALVERLRDNVVPATALAHVASVDVGGETARSQDARAQVSGSMWKIILFVLALSYLVLMVMLRSLLLPLKAVLMNLLSIGAAFGVLVAIFQWGWFDSLLGFENQGALDTINVPLIFAIVFGLSMDYEVFLMSRIREHYLEHGDNERAVAEGLSTSARTISSAALIMTCGLRRLRPHRGALDQGARPRLRGGDRARRDPGPPDPGAGGDEAARRLELVDALLARPGPARPQLRGRRAGARARRGLSFRCALCGPDHIKRTGTADE